MKEEHASKEVDYIVDQFFVTKKYMGKGVGKSAALQMFTLFQGKWRVTQIEQNLPAQAFWRRIINEYMNGKQSERFDEQRRSVQEFDNRAVYSS